VQRCHAAEDLRDRGLQAGMRVADRELHTDQAALDQAAQERGPERLGLGLADVDAQDLAAAGLVHAVRDHQRLVDHPAAVADLLHLGVEKDIRVAALQRARPERVDVLIQRPADAADLAATDPQAEALHELIDPPGRDAAHVGLLDHRQQRLLRAPPRLQKAREVAALAQLGDLQVDLARARVPPPRPVPVAVRRAVIRAALAELCADLAGHLAFHQLHAHGLHRRAQPVAVLVHHHVLDDLRDRHPVGTGHRWRLLSKVEP
jgi:hypothetical protein